MKTFKVIAGTGTKAKVRVTITPHWIFRILGAKVKTRIAVNDNLNNDRKWCWEDSAKKISGDFLGPRLTNACRIFAVNNPDKSNEIYT